MIYENGQTAQGGKGYIPKKGKRKKGGKETHLLIWTKQFNIRNFGWARQSRDKLSFFALQIRYDWISNST